MESKRRMSRSPLMQLLLLGMTAVFIGYLSVWLPGPGAGLTFLGLELGEWIKFMGVGPARNLFYLPPITLALMLVALTLPWENGRWQTWAMRGTAVLLSGLAFPAWEDITGPASQDYMTRIYWMGWVVVAVLVTAVCGWLLPRATCRWLCWLCLLILGLGGAWLPARLYMQIRPQVSQLFGVPVGFGGGLVLNGAGHLLIAGVSLWQMAWKKWEKRSA